MDIFVHIPKTAGSTLRSILKRVYKNSIFYFEPQNPNVSREHLFSDLKGFCLDNDTGLITGHYPYGIHDIIYKKSRYFSFIREPLQRAVSDFYYAYQFDDHPYLDEIINGKVSLKDYLLSGSFAKGGDQCAMIAGTYHDSDMLASQAISAIETNYIFVGITEFFNRDLLILSKKMNWANPFYLTRNKTSFKSEWKDAIQDVSDRYTLDIEAHFKDDYSLYRYVYEKNLDVGRHYDGELARALASFNRIYFDLQNTNPESGKHKYDFDKISDEELMATGAAITSMDAHLVRSFLYSQEKTFPQHNYVGFLEECSGTRVRGWVADLVDDSPVSFRVVIKNRTVGKFYTDAAREDIDMFLNRQGCMTGFDIDLGVDSGDALIFPGRRDTPIAKLVQQAC